MGDGLVIIDDVIDESRPVDHEALASWWSGRKARPPMPGTVYHAKGDLIGRVLGDDRWVIHRPWRRISLASIAEMPLLLQLLLYGNGVHVVDPHGVSMAEVPLVRHTALASLGARAMGFIWR